MRSLWQSCASVQPISATGRQNRFLLISDCFWGGKISIFFSPKTDILDHSNHSRTIVVNDSLNTKMCKCVQVTRIKVNHIIFRSQTGQQHENIFLSPPPFFLPFVFCFKEKHTCCTWNKNYPIYVETLKYTIWDMDEMVGMEGWLNGHPLDSAFKHSTEKCFVIYLQGAPKNVW